MFGLGYSEIIVILVILIVMVPPKNLPGLFRKAGKLYTRAMRVLNHYRKEFVNLEQELKALSKIEDELNDKNNKRS